MVKVFEGQASTNDSPQLAEAEMVWLDIDGELVHVEAAEASKILVLSGKPLGEPVVAHGPFVMNTSEEIEQAIRDFQSGRMGRLD